MGSVSSPAMCQEASEQSDLGPAARQPFLPPHADHQHALHALLPAAKALTAFSMGQDPYAPAPLAVAASTETPAPAGGSILLPHHLPTMPEIGQL